MKLAIISLKKFYRSSDGGYWSYGGFGEYVRSLLPYFDEITLCVPVGGERQPGAYQLDPGRVKIVELPFYLNELELMLRLPIILWRMRSHIKSCDVANPRIPDMTGVCGWIWAKIYRKPMFISITSDITELLEQPNFTKQKGIIKTGLYLWLKLYLLLERVIVSSELSFAQGDKLYRRYSEYGLVKPWLSSAISRNDIINEKVAKTRIDIGTHVNLLHVGRVTLQKGHYRLIKVLQELKAISKRKYKLYCVGKQDKKLLNELIARAKEAGVAGQIEWVEHVSRGQALFDYFDNSHVFIFTSLWEGTPKVLLESLARGLPIVTVNVGGVSSIVKNGETGLLLPKFDAKLMAEKIEQLLNDRDLRLRLIMNGLRVASSKTTEVQASKLITGLAERYPHLATKLKCK